MKRNTAIEADVDVLAKLCEEGFERGSELEAFAGCEVEGHGDLLDVVVVEGVEVGVAREPSSDAPVGIFDATLLPAGVGIAEIRGLREHSAQPGMAGEGGVVVEGDRSAHLRRQPLQDGHEGGDRLGGGLAHEPRHQREAGLAFMKHENRASALADHQVGLPMAGLGAGVGGIRTLRNMDFILDPASRGPGLAPAAAGLAARQVAPELLGLLAGAEDPGVDRLGRERPQAPLDPAPEPPGDLLRRPAFDQTIRHIGRKRRVPLKQRGTPAPEQVASIGDLGPVGAALQRIAPELPADRRGSPAERPSNRPDTPSGGLQLGDLVPFPAVEVRVS